jgi:GAF domain-containing protein/sugar diacid utilization regulator
VVSDVTSGSGASARNGSAGVGSAGIAWAGVAQCRPQPARLYLELLASEASAMEFERPLLEARSRGADAAEIADLDATKALALQVRATLERRRRRQQELAALFETAGDLAACRDVDAVLAAIVHRTRQLLGADLAYLTFNDPERGDTFMRVTDGSVSAAFRRLRLAMGCGLGGLVAQNALPYVTANYFEDDRFRHTLPIDAAVEEEGLVAILGVPLLLGSRVLGVLYAANRHPRAFSPEEVSLVGSLAAHAAVALDTARLLEDTRTALERLSETSRLLRQHSESVDRAAAVHDRLTSVVLRGGGAEDVARVVASVLGGALRMADADGHSLAEAGTSGSERPLWELAEAVSRSGRTGRAEREHDTWVLAVVAGAEQLGGLVLDGRPDLDGADLRSFERAGLVTALLLLFRRSLAEAESRVRGELIDDLLARPAIRDPEGLRARAHRVGADLEAPHVVVAARAARDGERHQVLAAAAHLAALLGGLAGERDGDVVLLLPGTDAAGVGESARRSLGAGPAPVTLGLAGPVTGPAAIRAAVDVARRCMQASIALGRPGRLATSSDLGFVGLLLGAGGDVAGYVDATIGPLLRYDQRRGTALCRTLEQFYAGGASLGRTAEALHVHVNTVTQRLTRIDQLLGDGWRQPERGLEIQLALRLRCLPAADPPGASV